MKKFVLPVVFVLLVAASYFVLGRKPSRGPGESSMTTAKVQRGDLIVTVSSTGTIEPVVTVEVKSKASGVVNRLPVEEGDHVEKGQIIATLDETDLLNDVEQSKADLDVAKATLAQAERELKKSQELLGRNLASEDEVEKLKTEVVRAKAQLVRARVDVANKDERLKEAVVRAPLSGIILQKNVEEGQIISSGISSVSGGTLIAVVADMREVYVKADVDETDIAVIEPGQKAKVVADAYPDDIFEGEIVRIAPLAKVEQNVTTFEVTSKVANPQGKLKAGMNATVDIAAGERFGVLMVPNEALREPGRGLNRGEGNGEKGSVSVSPGPGKTGEKNAPASTDPRASARGDDRSRRAGGGVAGEIPGGMAGQERQGAGEAKEGGVTGGRPVGARGGYGVLTERSPGSGGAKEEGGGPGASWGREKFDAAAPRPKAKQVMVGRGGKFVPEIVLAGINNFENTEILQGLKEGDEIQILTGGPSGSMSQTMEQRERFKARMSQGEMGGLRR
ncbi:MAG: efflux RND transporter periplasmic adaptor subunit [Candidatus Eisenbacteria bacterium]|nr:efflux RND transporter periplasmic adaptor subunit [Candidatus Eisenbacteria bacterium]